jgi:hypothetical protein
MARLEALGPWCQHMSRQRCQHHQNQNSALETECCYCLETQGLGHWESPSPWQLVSVRSHDHTFVQPFRNFHLPTHATGCMQCPRWPTGFA